MCSIKVFFSMCEQRLLNIVAFRECDCRFHICLMASIADEELDPEKRQRFLSLHKLVCTEVERNDRVITVGVYSHPLSSVAIAECWPYLRCICSLCVFF